MSIIPDYPDYAPHVATAQQIAATGVPLLGNPGQLGTASLAVIAGGGVKAYPVTNLAQTGYHGEFGVTFPAGTAIPFVEVELTWSDAATGFTVATDHYIIPGATSPHTFNVFASGTAKANRIQVSLINLDASNSATVTWVVNQDSITRPHDRWYWNNTIANLGTVPGNTLPTLPDDESVLGILNAVTINAATSASFLCGMAPGQLVQFAGNTAGISPGSISMNVFAAPGSVYTAGGLLLQEVLTTAAFGFTFVAPRAPLLATIHNNATSGTLTVSGMMTAQTA